jgi:hypothetical protein
MTPAKSTAAPASPPRETMPVRVLKFCQPQDGPGFAVSSALTAKCKTNRNGRHTIEFVPWLRLFRVSYTADDSTLVAYIPEHRVSCWYPLEA